MRIDTELKLDYKDVLLRPKRSTLTSRSEVKVTRTFHLHNLGKDIKAMPIVAANMDGVGTFAMAKALAQHDMMTSLKKYYEIPDLADFFTQLDTRTASHVFYTMGIKDEDLQKLTALLKTVDSARVPNLCVDVANGYTERFAIFVQKLRQQYPDKVIMAGNVVTGEMTEELILSGADIVKVGIGSGSACTTRKITGVGYPQLSAVIECADAAHGVGGLICADGGCVVPGDIVKAFGAGADLVMVGGMLAGHDESEAPIMEEDGQKFIEFYGSSSEKAMEQHHGGISPYRAGEGRCVQLPHRGPVERTVQDILGGLRSACTYVGARNLKELSKRTTFVRVSQQLNTIYGE